MSVPYTPAIVGTDVEQTNMSWAALDIIPDAVLLVSGKASVQRTNRVAVELFGRFSAELLGAHLGDLLECEELAVGGWSTALILHCPRPAAGHRFLQASGRRGDGSLFRCEISISALVSQTDNARWLVTIRTTTHRDFHESRIRESVKMTALSDLAARVANDLNNQLAAISGNLESLGLTGRSLGDAGEQELEAAREATRTAARIVRRLSTLADPARAKKRPIDLTDVVQSVTSRVPEDSESKITVSTSFNHGGWMVSGDPDQLGDILTNCCANAREAMPQGGLVSISTHRAVSPDVAATNDFKIGRREYVRIDVTDSGTGIEPDILPRIFDPFFTTKENAPGAGLGLATAYSVLGQHEGGVTVESAVGVGTTVHIFLPRTIVTPHNTTPSTQTHGSETNETILLIDDEAVVRGPTRRVLERYGYTVLEAQNGAQGLALYQRERDRVGLVLLDIVMPEMSGWEVLSHLRDTAPSLPVVFVSGYPAADQPGDTVDKADAFLAKPFSLADLLGTVRRLLDQCAVA